MTGNTFIYDSFLESYTSNIHIKVITENDFLVIYIDNKLVIQPGTNDIYVSRFLLDKNSDLHFTWFDINTVQLCVDNDIQCYYYINISNPRDDNYFHVYNYIP